MEALKKPLNEFKDALQLLPNSTKSLLPASYLAEVASIVSSINLASTIKTDTETLSSQALSSLTSVELGNITTRSEFAKKLISDMSNLVKDLEGKKELAVEYKDNLLVLLLERQLLSDILAIDTERNFYYNVPVEDHLAIELNESEKSLNTLLNPITNYDINNVNNCFVISKLDIDYLDNGLKIARSSRLN